MLRVISNFGKKGALKSSKLNRGSGQVVRINFSTQQKVTSDSTEQRVEKTFEEKADFFERYSNSYIGQDNLKETIQIKQKLAQNNFSQESIQDIIISDLKEIYGKNYEKILNSRFQMEIHGHKDGVALGEFELFPKNLLDHGKFSKYTKNGDLIEELHQTTYTSINGKEIHKFVVPQESHFSLYLDEFIPDEYVSELSDNQVCVFGYPKSCDESDIQTLFKDQFKANYTSIQTGDCVLSLPAYTILTFANQQEAQDFKQKFNSSKQMMGGRPIYATTFEDSRNEHSTNRTLLVSGFRETESFNDLLNFLSSLGSVMHFEIVEEPLNQKLPSTEQVLSYLKSHVKVKEGDDSIIYEITDISDGAPIITEYPPHNPQSKAVRDGKKLSDIADEIQFEKERHEQLAKRELIPRMVLYTWDSDSQLPEEYKLKNSTPEQKRLLSKIENELRSEYTNKQYLFITYACLQQAQLAYHVLNRTGIYETTLKKSTEHYHCDTQHQTSVFKQIKQIKGDIKVKLNDQSLSALEQDKVYAQSHQEMKDQLIEQVNGQQFTSSLSQLLENEIIGKTKHGIEHQLHLKTEKPGREFSTKIVKDDLNQIATQMQDRQKQNMEQIESLKKSEDEMLTLYRAKVMNADINKITHPYIQIDAQSSEEIISNIQDQATVQYKARQQEYLREQAIKAKWMEDTKEMIERKLSFTRTPGKARQSRGDKDSVDDLPEIKEKEEEPDQYYVPLNDYTLSKKNNKYMKYVGEMQRLYDGEFSEAMKERIFKNGNESCTDVDGKTYVSEAQGIQIDRLILSDEQLESIKYFNSIYDVLPNKRIKQLHDMIQESPDETLYMLNQTKLPTRVFDRSQIPEIDESAVPLSNEDFVGELNKYVAELGQEYAVQKDARGDEKIIMFENTPHAVPIQALNVDEIQLLRDCLTTYGFDAEATEKEIQYFIKNGDYSEEVLKIVGSEQTIDEESELDDLIHATGLSKAELESILKLDLEKEGASIVQSIQEQREEAAFEIKMGTAQPKDLIKTNTKLRNKDKQGRYKQSTFKFF